MEEHQEGMAKLKEELGEERGKVALLEREAVADKLKVEEAGGKLLDAETKLERRDK